MWLTKDVLLTQLTIQQQITLLHSIVLLHFLHKACADACVNFLNTNVTDGGSVYFSSRTQTKRIEAIVPVTNYSLTGNYEYSLKTLNIDCCVLTLNLNEIKTNINHMLALQQTLLDPLLMQTDSSPRWRTLTPFIPINLNFKCCGIICKFHQFRICICTSSICCLSTGSQTHRLLSNCWPSTICPSVEIDGSPSRGI